MRARGNAAIVAGLGVGVSLALPASAHAVSVSAILEETFSNPVTTFAVGVAGGAALASLAALAIAAVRRDNNDPEPPDEKSTYAPRHLRAANATDDSRNDAPEEASEETSAESEVEATANYEEVAQNYVGSASFKQRMSRRAAGVAAALRERLGQGMMDGLPVIERADGTVADVGTSWWRHAVGEDSFVQTPGFVMGGELFAIPSDFTKTDKDLLVASADRHAGAISARVAYVDEGTYPERRTVEDLDNSDAWERALRSLDEKIAAVAPPQDPIGFIDNVGGADSLDEPDNLEPQTDFIHFKAPGGHPEVVDTGSYVDFLIEDEFSRNTSKAVRKTSRRFLRVLEGGTSVNKRLQAEILDSTYVGKHFSLPIAAEA